jgi:hypothetical protein
VTAEVEAAEDAAEAAARGTQVYARSAGELSADVHEQVGKAKGSCTSPDEHRV